MGGENNPFLGIGESLYYTGYLCYTVAMLQTFEGGIFVYEKLIILNTLVYSVWCFYFSRQILKERFTPGDMLPPLKSYDFEVGASCSIAF